MKKSLFFLFQLLGVAVKAILTFSLVIIGIDLFNKYFEDKNASDKKL